MNDFNTLTSTLAKAIKRSGASLDRSFVSAVRTGASSADGKMAVNGKLTKAGEAYVDEFIEAVFGKQSVAYAAWKASPFKSSTFSAYKARSRDALAALLVNPAVKAKSLAKLAEAGAGLVAKQQGNGKSKGKGAPTNVLTGDMLKQAESLLRRMPKGTAKLAYGAELAVFLRTLTNKPAK